MSRFDEIKERERDQARRRARPSALLIAWSAVLLAMGGVVIWLVVTGPGPTPPEAEFPTEMAVPDEGPQGTAEITTGMPDPEPQPMPAETAEPPAATLPPESARSGMDSTQAISLATDTNPALLQETDRGHLPVRAADGRAAWQVYARPFDEFDTRPRIAIIITGAGLSSGRSQAALDTLPADVTLALSHYASDPERWVDAAREKGHEVLLMVPMEPGDYPRNDPGPQTLLVDASAAENLTRLHDVLSRATRYVGVINQMGSRFTASEAAMTPILDDLRNRGLLFMDARSTQYTVGVRLAREMRLPRAANNRFIDNALNEAEILRQLEDIENMARTYGAAAGVGRLYPVTIRTVARWAETLDERGFVLAPVSAIANRQPVQ
ncbi:MAG: divergent polysaccharide deacetylase family protein [Sphingomonadales bacterium]